MIATSHTLWGKFPQINRIFKFKKRWFESSTRNHSETQLTQTTICVQEGTRIQEVPAIVRKITDVAALFGKESKRAVSEKLSALNKDKEPAIIQKENIPPSTVTSMMKNEPLKHSISIETDEGTAILFYSDMESLKDMDIERVLDAIMSGSRDKGVYSLLENKMPDEIGCRIALQSLKKMIELENGWYKYRKALSSGQSSAEVTNRDIILRQLVSAVIKSRDSEMILQGLKALKRDRFSPAKNIYKDWMCNEAMIRATDGEFTVSQLIRAVRILSSYKDSKYKNCVDILWIGLACKEHDIKPEFLVPLFKSLKHFYRSRNIVQIILEKKLSEQWINLSGSQMGNILDSVYGRDTSKESLASASKWAAVSMTTSTEKDLASFISSLHTKKYVDESIEQALARYVTAKGATIKDPHLIASITEYCKDLKVRNSYVLNGCGKYFTRHGMEISPSLLPPILTSFGLLNSQPPDTAEFWRTFDEVIAARFSDLKLNDILDIFLSCTYLEKFPVKFLDKVFSSYLTSRLQIHRDMPIVNHLKIKLKLFDATMSLECKDYQGSPINLDRDSKSLSLDTRIRGIVNKIYKPLAHLIGGEHKLSRSVVLNKMPLINFYVLDVLVHPFLKSAQTFNLGLHKKRNVNIAILIHLPEYYCWNTQLLIGPQVMRKRQMRKLGFRVACLNYAKLTELVDQDDKLLAYLSQNLDAAEDAL